MFNLEELYTLKHLERGYSSAVDEAILYILEIDFREDKEAEFKFQNAWVFFRKIVDCDYPNISVHNLLALERFLASYSLIDEDYFVICLINELTPSDAQSCIQLAAIHEQNGEYHEAILNYIKARGWIYEYMLCEGHSSSHALWLETMSCFILEAQCHEKLGQKKEGLAKLGNCEKLRRYTDRSWKSLDSIAKFYSRTKAKLSRIEE